MTDLEALRTALAAPPAEQFGKVDVDRIMKLGARKRARRRLGAAGGALAAVVAVLCTVVGIGQLRAGPPPAPSLAVAAAQAVTSAAPPPGAVITTSCSDSGGEIVLSLEQGAASSGLASYVLVLGHRDATGHVTAETATGVRQASPGFHALTAGRPGRDLPLYGYYAGPARRITAQVHNLTVTAQTSVVPDADVTVFWFPTKDTALLGGTTAIPLYAYDANGHQIVG